MPITTDSTTNFPSGLAGYTQFNSSNISAVVNGDTKLVAGSPLAAAIRTPGINVGGWTNAIRSVAITSTDAVGYKHRFFVSFDNWSNTGRKYYSTFRGGEWVRVASDLTSTADLVALVNSEGMGRGDLERVRVWPALAEIGRLQFLVGLRRETAGGTGSIGAIGVSYGTETLTVSTEGTASGTLSIQPDFPITCEYTQSFSIATAKSYDQIVETGTALRRSFNVSWAALSEADKDTVLALLNGGKETPFNWTPYGFSASTFCTIGNPVERQVGPGVYSLSATLQETLP